MTFYDAQGLFNAPGLRFSMRFAISLLAVFLFSPPCIWALTADQVLVVTNRNASDSIALATYYMQKRNIPESNLLKVRVTDEERCSREEYEGSVADPIRKYLREKDPQNRIHCLLLIYGMPLTVAPPQLTPEERSRIQELEKQIASLNERIKILETGEERSALENKREALKKQIQALRKTDQFSALDSEISLVRNEDYPLSGWIPNPGFLHNPARKIGKSFNDPLLVSRLDGPSEDIVRRVIDDSLMAETVGISGTAYFDARYPEPSSRPTSVYGLYDASLHKCARQIKSMAALPLQIETTNALFQPGDCPDAALYCGWYSLARYVDAFGWKPGSIGYHLASQECQTLKAESSRVWCKKMLEDGIAATLGPVGEPYLQAFPLPEIFFGLLLAGDATLAECYFRSNPYLSWKMVLIGDPLYNPFKKIPIRPVPVDND